MNRIFMLTTLALVLPFVGAGQTTPRYWEKGPLTWNDFAVVDRSIGAEHSYLEFGLDVILRPQEVEGGTLQVRTAVAYAVKEMSWVDSNYRTPPQLRYNQVLFNIAELHRRRLQVVVDTGGNVNMEYYMRLLMHETDSFCLATNYGNDTVEVLWWEQDVRRQLDSITPLMVQKHQEANAIKGFRSDSHFGMMMGGGAKFFTGDLYSLVAPSGGFYFDIETGKWRHSFTFGFYIGGGGCKLDSISAVNYSNTLLRDDKITTLDLHVDYGFAVLDGQRLTVTPFVGYGLQGFYYSADEESVSGGPSEGCWRLGVDAKYDFGLETAGGFNEVTLFGVTAQGKVYVCFDRFRSIRNTPRGLTLNAQLGLGIRIRDRQVLRPAVKKEAATPALGRRVMIR